MKSFSFLLAFLPALLLAAVVPLTLDGALDSVTADSTSYNTGGKISVNGVTITIPKNTQFQFPAAFIPFKEVAAGNFLGNEVSVEGNYVDGVAIAGLVSIAQFSLQASTGVIASLSVDGGIKMVGGQTIRINDPNAVYSAGYKLNPAFTADDQNPSVTAFSGFPMCVPRSATDPKCPTSNRPSGQNTFTAPDALTMAPLLAGDYIEYSGIRVGGEIICYALVAPSVQILTTGVPAYIRVEDAIIGVVDGQAAGGVEFADTRFIGYTTDASVSLTISRNEVDPCTGDIKSVAVGSASPRAGDARNKWIWRATSSIATTYTREYNITASSGTKVTNGGQILAGQYIQPVGEWIFPENTNPGTIPAKNDFSPFSWLRLGSGPDADGNIWGPLSPWPDSTAPPAAASCAPVTPPSTSSAVPVANAGKNQALRPGVKVTLDGSADNAPSFAAKDLTYAWTQTVGPTVTLVGGNTATPSFTLSSVTALTTYTFELTVTSTQWKTSSSARVTITNDPKKSDTVTIDSYTWTTQQGGTISVTAHSNVIDGSAKLTLVLNNPAASAPITMISAGGGKFTYNSRSTKRPSNGVAVSSNLGGTQSTTSTTAKKRRSR